MLKKRNITILISTLIIAIPMVNIDAMNKFNYKNSQYKKIEKNIKTEEKLQPKKTTTNTNKKTFMPVNEVLMKKFNLKINQNYGKKDKKNTFKNFKKKIQFPAQAKQLNKKIMNIDCRPFEKQKKTNLKSYFDIYFKKKYNLDLNKIKQRIKKFKLRKKGQKIELNEPKEKKLNNNNKINTNNAHLKEFEMESKSQANEVFEQSKLYLNKPKLINIDIIIREDKDKNKLRKMFIYREKNPFKGLEIETPLMNSKKKANEDNKTKEIYLEKPKLINNNTIGKKNKNKSIKMVTYPRNDPFKSLEIETPLMNNKKETNENRKYRKSSGYSIVNLKPENIASNRKKNIMAIKNLNPEIREEESIELKEESEDKTDENDNSYIYIVHNE